MREPVPKRILARAWAVVVGGGVGVGWEGGEEGGNWGVGRGVERRSA